MAVAAMPSANEPQSPGENVAIGIRRRRAGAAGAGGGAGREQRERERRQDEDGDEAFHESPFSRDAVARIVAGESRFVVTRNV